MTALDSLLLDLRDETAVLYDRLDGLTPADWALPTPADRWTVADQVSHLMYFDETALMAVTDPERFRRHAAEMMGRGDDFPDQVAADLRTISPADLLARWRLARHRLIAAYSGQDRRRRLPWYGPEMSVMSAATARLMETWAHGVDIADALRLAVEPSERLRHVAYLGFATMPFSFTSHGLDAPAGAPRVELGGPSGTTWVFGPQDSVDRVSGPALDFCLVVTQRRPLGRTGLAVAAGAATTWMGVAQAFAGRPTVYQEKVTGADRPASRS